MKEIGNALLKHDMPLIWCSVGQLSPRIVTDFIYISFQKVGLEFNHKALQ